MTVEDKVGGRALRVRGAAKEEKKDEDVRCRYRAFRDRGNCSDQR
jgi:hypothetical protein